jgi:hypothetical protein
MKHQMINLKVRIALLASILLILHACTGFQTYPKVARAGDTISIAVGSPVGMTKDSNNTTAVYLPDSGGTFPLTLRSVFNLYPDKKSRLYLPNSVTASLINSAGHEAWQTVMMIDLPTNLPVGSGSIQITSIAEYPSINNHINNVPISLEIVSGIGQADTFSYEFGLGLSSPGDLSLLEALPHALITPPTDNEFYGAIEMKLLLPTTAATTLTEGKLRVVVDDMTPSTFSNRTVTWTVNSNEELVVIMMSASGGLLANESRFSIVLKPTFSFTAPPVISEVTYYDINGNIVVGHTPAEYTVTLN